MTAHPHDASDPSSADGPAVDAPPSHAADPHGPDRDDSGVEGLLGEIRARREKAQPIVDHWMLSSSTIALNRLDTYAVCISQMDVRALLALVDELRVKVAALTKDRDDARAALYRAQGAMLRMRDRCAELRAEVGATFKEWCDAATLAGVRERERDEARAEVGALTAERDALTVELATVTKGRDDAALMFEDSAVWAENAERDARSLRAAVERWQNWVDHRGNVGPLAAKYRAVGLSQVEQDLVDAACAFDREMGEGQ